jgi:hypothetical protein
MKRSVRIWFALAVILSVGNALAGDAQAGGVRRRLTIRSNPPGALVVIDDQEIGYTPVSTAFTYYGTRKIQLIKDGFETLTVKQAIKPPWYEYPPFDFLSENFSWSEVRDERVIDFQLIGQQIVPTDVLRGRAEELRDSARRGVITPLPTTPELLPAPLGAPPPLPLQPPQGPYVPRGGPYLPPR